MKLDPRLPLYPAAQVTNVVINGVQNRPPNIMSLFFNKPAVRQSVRQSDQELREEAGERKKENLTFAQ